ncbi:MAG: major capsid protein [Microviridae sp.]|nr:MAG: major capsid protein [Microviridae sp.]
MSNKLFNSVSGRSPQKNLFNLSHEKKLSLNMGELVPIFCQEVVPSDRFKLSSEILLRVAPLVSPIMHRVNVKLEAFFVPSRTLWDDWESFITGGPTGNDLPAFPYIDIAESRKQLFAKGTLSDYLGIAIPDQSASIIVNEKISALPFRAYQKIYNEYYRDQTLTPEVPFVTTGGALSGPEQEMIQELRRRSWEKDYFTSALPQPQRGGDVILPTDINYKTDVRAAAGTIQIGEDVNIGGTINPFHLKGKTSGAELQVENIEDIGTTITDFRRASRLQEWLEAMARGGSRYIEQMKTMFGVTSSDARLQRAEFLGSSVMPIQISEVLSTFNSETAENPVAGATMYGHGISAGSNFLFNKFFEEHGYIIVNLSVIPRSTYSSQGIPKMFQKFDKFEYYWPHFAHIGEQPILAKEIYYTGNAGDLAVPEVFGYTPRYAEYKFALSSVHGDFRDSLDYWHMSRTFTAPPPLNSEFIEADPTERIFAVTDPDVDKIYVQVYHNCTAVRPMPVFGTPHL